MEANHIMNTTTVDVLVIGAGLSGIGMACHLARDCPNLSLAIIERRQRLGGTWDLFRYPGIRSDSDMFSFGYKFRPWHALKVLADGPSIRQYIGETAKEYGVDEHIHFGLKTNVANWDTARRRWIVTAVNEETGEAQQFESRFLIPCTGYYNYDHGHMPVFPGADDFKGELIHPQHWPEDLDYSGKRVVIIGSGATSVTLVPAMAGKAAHVTMLQRSPSYIFSVPGFDKLSETLSRVLPSSMVYGMARKRNIVLQRMIYKAAKRWPKATRRMLLSGVKRQLGKNGDMSHFEPSYNPWDERLCAVPDGDLFAAIRKGEASIVTDHIDTFTESGIRLKSGRELEADIIISATGLELQMLGGMQMQLDGESQPTSDRMTYKGVLVEDVPNFGYIFGYINAPWTLKADLAAEYLCRLLRHMDSNHYDVVVPHDDEGVRVPGESIMDELASGYVRRGASGLPRQGTKLPWRVLHNYERDCDMLLKEPIEDGVLRFERADAGATQPEAAAA